MKIKSKQVQSRIITANAGSGKTYTVIKHIEEIISMGYSPSSILCITFTKAGMREIEKRLVEENLLTNEKPKIVTFHSLCLEIVSMFTHELKMPLEFETVEHLPPETIQAIIQELPYMQPAQEYIKEFKITPKKFADQCEFLINNYQKLHDEPIRLYAITNDIFQLSFEEAKTKKNSIQRQTLENIPLEILQALSGVTASKALPTILDVHTQIQTGIEEEKLEELFKQYTSAIKSIRNGGAVKEYRTQIEEVIEEINNIETFRQSFLLNKIVSDIITIAEKHKRQNKQYVFADLIHKALQVLQNPELKDFAMFKFGHSLKHVIVDEAQDTNAQQWEIIDHIISNIIAEGMDGGSLTIVGDNKQTIYGFQGSQEGMMDSIANKYGFLQKAYLAKSYRTTKPVLDVINKMSHTFNIDEHSTHISAFEKEVGSVNIFAYTKELPKKTKKDNETDETQEEDESIFHIAEKLAVTVEGLLQKNLQHEKAKYCGRKIIPDDIVILVKARPSVEAIDALKTEFYQRRIPISFNEKFSPKHSFAILDFLAILKLCIYSADKLSLYGILKSPVFQIPEQKLISVFKHETTAEEIYTTLSEVKNKIKEFTEYLNANGVRSLFQMLFHRYKSRYTPNEQQSLEIFIENTQTQYEPFKFVQDFESSSKTFTNQKSNQGTVRLTTAHSSKGLEYPIVIYLDLKDKEKNNTNPIIIHNGAVIFKPAGKIKGAKLKEVLHLQKQEDHAEKMRLYYVAVSRAAEHFYYICSQKITQKEDSLYALLKQGLLQLQAEVMHTENFECITYCKSIEVPTAEIKKMQTTTFTYKPQMQVQSIQTEGMLYGIFIHKLFETIETPNFDYTPYIDESINLQEEIEKVRRFNATIHETFQPSIVLREHEFIHNKEVIRLDAIYFCGEEVVIIDYKTQKQFVTQDIKTQLDNYRKATESFYGKKTRCFIAWYREEILEEV